MKEPRIENSCISRYRHHMSELTIPVRHLVGESGDRMNRASKRSRTTHDQTPVTSKAPLHVRTFGYQS